MNWGNKLVVVFLCFGMLIGFLVYRCMQVPVNLVSKDYYEDELAYQQVIDGKIMAAGLSSKVKLTTDNNQLTIQMPAEMESKEITGAIWFYCPAESANDRRAPLQTDQHGRQEMPAGFLAPGNYQVKIKWESGNSSYFSELPVNIVQ